MSEGPRSANRRIGERLEIEPVPATLVFDRQEGRWLRRRPLELHGQVVDVSVSGVAIECVGSAEVADRGMATLRVRGSESFVRVTRWSTSADGEVRTYGVVFVRLHPRLQTELFAVLGRGRPTPDRWFTAR